MEKIKHPSNFVANLVLLRLKLNLDKIFSPQREKKHILNSSYYPLQGIIGVFITE